MVISIAAEATVVHVTMARRRAFICSEGRSLSAKLDLRPFTFSTSEPRWLAVLHITGRPASRALNVPRRARYRPPPALAWVCASRMGKPEPAIVSSVNARRPRGVRSANRF